MRNFLSGWLLNGDFKAASFFVSPTAYACFDEPLDAANGRRAFLRGLTQVREALGRCARLAGYPAPFIPDESNARAGNPSESECLRHLLPVRADCGNLAVHKARQPRQHREGPTTRARLRDILCPGLSDEGA